MINAWRIVKAEHAADAFTGDGALENAGRWHSAGTRVVYTSEYVSLATLEVFVHMRKRAFWPNYVLIGCWFPEALVETLDVSRLPANWHEHPAPAELQSIGDLWSRTQSSAVLKVPTAITQIEFNYLLNPEHEDFKSIDIGEPRPFSFDLRLRI